MKDKQQYLDALIKAQASGQKLNAEINEVLAQWREELLHGEETVKVKAIRLAQENKKDVLTSYTLRDLYEEMRKRRFFYEMAERTGATDDELFDYFVYKGVT